VRLVVREVIANLFASETEQLVGGKHTQHAGLPSSKASNATSGFCSVALGHGMERNPDRGDRRPKVATRAYQQLLTLEEFNGSIFGNIAQSQQN
jgi:hypothetical protein